MKFQVSTYACSLRCLSWSCFVIWSDCGISLGHDALPATSLQGELKDSASALVCCRPEPPAVCLDNRATDSQSQAHALRLGCIESVEDAIETTRIYNQASRHGPGT